MADRSLLARLPGLISQRVAPQGWLAPQGRWVYVFGHDQPGWTGFFFPGDAVRIEQVDTYDAATVIRGRARLRGPLNALPAGWQWQAFARVGVSEIWSFDLDVGKTYDIDDLVIGAQGLGGGMIGLSYGLRIMGTGTDALEIEIPAFYLDEVVFDTVPGLIVGNRLPAPNATGVLDDSTIRFDLVSETGSPDETETTITVDGLVVFAAGVATAGWTVVYGTSLISQLRFTITPPVLWDSLRNIVVRVQATSTTGEELDATWSFTIEDLTAPRVLSASSTDHRTVVVNFDEVVKLVSASTSDDGLNPANYVITRTEAPSVAVQVIEVRALTTSSVELVLDIPITRGCLYVVAVNNVLDAFGNVIAAPWNVATFTGYVCPSPSNRRFDLWDAIPDVSKESDVTRDLYKFISLIQEPVDLQLCDIDRWTDILDVDVAPERFLDLMLYGLGNPFNFALSEVDKRRLIRVLPTIYSLKGTAKGIIDVVRFFLALEITIDAYNSASTWVLGVSELGVETTLGPSDRRALYSFDVVSAVGLTDSERARIREIVEYMKPAHTHLIRIVEPAPPTVIDHLELGFSELGVTWILH